MRQFNKYSLFILTLLSALPALGQHSVARQWNEALLGAIRKDFARPTVHARNLFHASVAMYDAWAAYSEEAEPFLLGKTVDGFTCPFDGIGLPPADVQAAREEAISYAAYRLLRHRFQNSPGAALTLANIDTLLSQLGYSSAFTSIDYSGGSPAALGNYIAQNIIDFGLQDGANEQNTYANQYYIPSNPPLAPVGPGNPDMLDPNRWQPLTLDVFIDQSGNVIPLSSPPFLSPEWGKVTPFSLQPEELTIYQRGGGEYWVYHDPGPPPYLDPIDGGGLSEEYKFNFLLVAIWSSHLAPDDNVMWDISPASIGNIQYIPQTIQEYHDFYDLLGGGDPRPGHALNPHTGQPYEPQLVPRGDYARVLAEFWADGPASETPPGHWFTILNYVNDHPEFEKRYRGQGPVLDELEWDVKAYLTIGGALHDVAITAWGIKGWYDYVRPVSAIRYMADRGQSSDPSLPNYHPAGVTLIPGYVEQITSSDPITLRGFNDEHINKIKLYAWRGPDYVNDPATDDAGVGWIRAEDWWPYQRPTFVTPPFAGYISGHSTYSRAAAEVLTLLTGDPFFPGGMGEFPCPKNEFLVFEEGPSVDMTLQWATYRDASDQCSLSRIWGGIHPPADDIPGRIIGAEIGVEAFHFAEQYFYRDQDGDGFLSYEDCDDGNPDINPGALETCDGIDNDCNGFADDDVAIFTYFLDTDGDSFGDGATRLDTCLANPPEGYVGNNLDCDDSDPGLNPNAVEVCDGIDNDCNGATDDGLPLHSYFLDQDGDLYGSLADVIDTCLDSPPQGYARNAQDCNDNNPNINPGAPEICDGIDNNCNAAIDDGLAFTTYFPDEDGDGFGDAEAGLETCLAEPPPGFVGNDMDCNDADSAINPDAAELPDGLDNNCNGMIDEGIVSTLSTQYGNWEIFPNPVREELILQSAYSGALTARLYSAEGRINQEARLEMASGRAVLDIRGAAPGFYFLELLNREGRRLLIERIIRY